MVCTGAGEAVLAVTAALDDGGLPLAARRRPPGCRRSPASGSRPRRGDQRPPGHAVGHGAGRRRRAAGSAPTPTATPCRSSSSSSTASRPPSRPGPGDAVVPGGPAVRARRRCARGLDARCPAAAAQRARHRSSTEGPRPASVGRTGAPLWHTGPRSSSGTWRRPARRPGGSPDREAPGMKADIHPKYVETTGQLHLRQHVHDEEHRPQRQDPRRRCSAATRSTRASRRSSTPAAASPGFEKRFGKRSK